MSWRMKSDFLVQNSREHFFKLGHWSNIPWIIQLVRGSMRARLGTSHAHAVTVRASSPTPASLPYGKVCRLANGFSKVTSNLKGLIFKHPECATEVTFKGKTDNNPY